jgi:REP element-mobilizing transposase RayT
LEELVVFAIQNRQSLIDKKWEVEWYKTMTGIIQNYNHKVIQINGKPDHIHILFGMRPTQSLSDLVKKIKADSSKWINKKNI